MVFSSMSFLGLFLPFVLVTYYITSKFSDKVCYLNYLLLAFSLLFYAWGEPVWILAMIFTAIVDYTNGKSIARARVQGRPMRRYLMASVVINLGILFVFKYLDFTLSTVNHLLDINLPILEISMPIGISFYTFQSLSYVIDLYRGRAGVQRNFFNYLLYVSMFPQLVAGPIVRYVDIEAQIRSRKVEQEDLIYGIKRFIIGLGKKVLLANNAGKGVGLIFGPNISELPMMSAWLGVILFTFQIYFDFSGYSDMAIGLGRMFGFKYNENFNYPYISKSVTEFWRRWHISLGTYFKDYVYIPLGGNKKYKFRNIFIVWFLTGLWHGASWNFIIWGLYYGVILMIEKQLMEQNIGKYKIVGNIYTLVLVVFGWGIFYFDDTSMLIGFIQAFFHINNASLYDAKTISVFMDYLILLPVFVIGATPLPASVFKILPRDSRALQLAQAIMIMALGLVSFLYLVGESYNAFLCFRF